LRALGHGSTKGATGKTEQRDDGVGLHLAKV
jgi:hypothetical protein